MSEPFVLPNDWTCVHTLNLPSREKRLFPVDDLPLSSASQGALAAGNSGLYRHQKEALQQVIAGANVCLSTGTASGKSLPFLLAGVEKLARNPAARVIAIYPIKALGYEQEDRWKQILRTAGLTAQVGRIDGQVSTKNRAAILRRCRVLIVTPDIVHAWLLGSLAESAVSSFLKNTSLVVIDEVHSYTGVFGSNSAFLFRRLQHAMKLLGADPQYIVASATIAEPQQHLEKLFGLNFQIIGPEHDTSPRHAVQIRLVNPPASGDILTQVSSLLDHVALSDSSKFIAFVDSRKQAEHISSILARRQDQHESDDLQTGLAFDHLQDLNVLPFRAGFEEHDRNTIQERLRSGSLRGVVSTSALELGIDIPALDTGILVGVPRSSTSLHQRIGRIGRHGEGTVYVINTGSIYDEAIFQRPQEFLARPMAQSTLYLENARIQYIHALSLARQGGEHDQVCSLLNQAAPTEIDSTVVWPNGFMELCRQERLGEVPNDLQNMKAEAGDDPNHVYPLRDVESQFKIVLKQGPEMQQLGSVSYGQLMREAYPGAIYYYISQPYRIHKVLVRSREILARREKRYTTKSQFLPTMVFPNLGAGNVYHGQRHDNLAAAECNLQIRESICGFKERRGPNEFSCNYPMQANTGITFNMPLFTRNFFTTGVILTHPVMSQEGVDCLAIANLLYEAFLILVPFERQDINFGVDKHRTQRGEIAEGDKFIAFYDQTYGSLRLSGRLLEDHWLERTLGKAVELCVNQPDLQQNPNTLAALQTLLSSAAQPGHPFSFDSDESIITPQNCVKIILEGSKGLKTDQNSPEEFEVEKIFYNPTINGLSYRGRRESLPGDTNKSIVPISSVVDIPGVSRVGYYDYETGEITPA